MSTRRPSFARGLGWLALLCGAAQVVASAELQPFDASYSFNWNGLTAGNAELQLRRAGNGTWSYQQRVQARGLGRLARSFLPPDLSSSVFTVQDGRVVPQRFSADRGKSEYQLTFDWTQGRVTGSFEGTPVDLPTQPGLLDSLTVQVALMNELLAGRTPERYLELDETIVKEYIYTAEGSATLRTGVGEHRTLIYRSTRPGSKKSTWFWCAPELGYLPLKVERREGKEVKWSMAVKAIDRNIR